MGRGGRGRAEAETPYHSSCRLSAPRAHCPINLFAVSLTLYGAPSHPGYSNGKS